MMNFATMNWGVIEADEGFIIVIKGSFHGPFDVKELRFIVDKMKENNKK